MNHAHRRVEMTSPLAPGWEIGTAMKSESGEMKVEWYPIAAMATGSLWYCSSVRCYDPFGCLITGDAHEETYQAFWPIWARGFSIVGDGFDLEDDADFLIVGPGEHHRKAELEGCLLEGGDSLSA